MRTTYKLIEFEPYESNLIKYFTLNQYVGKELVGVLVFSYVKNIYEYYSFDCLKKYNKRKSIYLDEIKIEKKYRNQLYGTKLINKFFSIIKNYKHSSVVLNAFPLYPDKVPLETLIKFYSKYNFKLVYSKELDNIMVRKSS